MTNRNPATIIYLKTNKRVREINSIQDEMSLSRVDESTFILEKKSKGVFPIFMIQKDADQLFCDHKGPSCSGLDPFTFSIFITVDESINVVQLIQQATLHSETIETNPGFLISRLKATSTIVSQENLFQDCEQMKGWNQAVKTENMGFFRTPPNQVAALVTFLLESTADFGLTRYDAGRIERLNVGETLAFLKCNINVDSDIFKIIESNGFDGASILQLNDKDFEEMGAPKGSVHRWKRFKDQIKPSGPLSLKLYLQVHVKDPELFNLFLQRYQIHLESTCDSRVVECTLNCSQFGMLCLTELSSNTLSVLKSQTELEFLHSLSRQSAPPPTHSSYRRPKSRLSNSSSFSTESVNSEPHMGYSFPVPSSHLSDSPNTSHSDLTHPPLMSSSFDTDPRSPTACPPLSSHYRGSFQESSSPATKGLEFNTSAYSRMPFAPSVIIRSLSYPNNQKLIVADQGSVPKLIADNQGSTPKLIADNQGSTPKLIADDKRSVQNFTARGEQERTLAPPITQIACDPKQESTPVHIPVSPYMNQTKPSAAAPFDYNRQRKAQLLGFPMSQPKTPNTALPAQINDLKKLTTTGAKVTDEILHFGSAEYIEKNIFRQTKKTSVFVLSSTYLSWHKKWDPETKKRRPKRGGLDLRKETQPQLTIIHKNEYALTISTSKGSIKMMLENRQDFMNWLMAFGQTSWIETQTQEVINCFEACFGLAGKSISDIKTVPTKHNFYGTQMSISHGVFEGDPIELRQHDIDITNREYLRASYVIPSLFSFFNTMDGLKNLKHDNITQLKGYFRKNNSIGSIIEQPPTPLNEWRTNHTSPQENFHVAAGITAGLAYLHEKQIPHKNFFPDRVLVSASGAVKLTGWEEDSPESSEFPQYAPPEKPQSNLFHANIWLYELVHGTIPESKSMSIALFREQYLNHKYRPPIQRTKAGLSQLIQKCWSQDPTQRPNARYVSTALTTMSVSDFEPLPALQPYPLPLYRGAFDGIQWDHTDHSDWNPEFKALLMKRFGDPSMNPERLKYLFTDHTGMVSKSQFKAVEQTFPELMATGLASRLKPVILQICSSMVFWGALSTQQAKLLLKDTPTGTYLFRLSSQAGYFALSCSLGQQTSLSWKVQFRSKTDSVSFSLENEQQDCPSLLHLAHTFSQEKNPLTAQGILLKEPLFRDVTCEGEAEECMNYLAAFEQLNKQNQSVELLEEDDDSSIEDY